MTHSVRRVVTGLDSEGRSTVLFDDRAEVGVLWRTQTTPADNSGTDDTACDFSVDLFRNPGSTFMLFELPAGQASPMHATDTIDYIIVLKGRIELQLEAGSVELGSGDCVVDRGVIHAWRALGSEPAVTIGALVPAKPVGAGATM